MGAMLPACRGTATLPGGDRRDISSPVPATATRFGAAGAATARASPAARGCATLLSHLNRTICKMKGEG